ncbi:hypothetical protein F5050DRAFT_1771150 [Lentinula boryana]|uniref:Uncharacterized protein n=1 Tax=Lentinula boryana TaxID=40481 RepID=A0ABQ8Q8T6_9AGAR|nr:hypothetical protein F5050DRAFT_1771150 [Lentinula boryana]
MSYCATSFEFVRHILDDHPVQTVSIAAMLVIVSLLYANDSSLLVGAQGLGVLFLLPFGFKVTFIYFLFYIACATYRVTPPSRTSDPVNQTVPETALNTDWRPPTPDRLYLRPLTIQLSVKGWSIDVHFSLEVLFVVFENYHLDHARWLNQNLEKHFRPRNSGVSIEFILNPADRISDTDTFSNHGEQGCNSLFKIRYHEHEAKSVYEFALTQEQIAIPLEAIPPQFCAGGRFWFIEAPNFSEFVRFLENALCPGRMMEDIAEDYEEIARDSGRFVVDLSQATASIIVPVLKAIHFESNLMHGDTIDRSFEQIT